MASLVFAAALVLLIATSIVAKRRLVFLGVLLLFDVVCVGLLARFGPTLG